MTDALLQTVLQGVLVFLVVMLLPTVYRMVSGPRIADRLLALDMITTLLIAIMVVLASIARSSLLMDVALALSALSFVATLALSRFVGEGRVF